MGQAGSAHTTSAHLLQTRSLSAIRSDQETAQESDLESRDEGERDGREHVLTWDSGAR